MPDEYGYDTVEEIADVLAPIFQFNGWTWGKEERIPDSEEIAEQLRSLVESAKAATAYSVGMGRLSAAYNREDKDFGVITVSLELGVLLAEDE